MAANANTFLLVTILILVTILLVFGMKYSSVARQARARLASDDAYRELAARATAAHSESAASLSSLHAELGEIKVRVASMEKLLKDVG